MGGSSSTLQSQVEPFAQVELKTLKNAFQKIIHLKSYATLDVVLQTCPLFIYYKKRPTNLEYTLAQCCQHNLLKEDDIEIGLTKEQHQAIFDYAGNF